ncbi:MAG: hypothetical protein B6U95_09620 [Thermofilum sp. ex4484_82]|nr:MAG: hypothetical protein B6U95_09620 [Thermofilum sp. ex4484_82]OYT35729.1 MAG: hypothetical protein B6U96_09630 [Archaeoglobales archaeon ex4484_92]
MKEEKVLDYLTEHKIAFLSEISSNISIPSGHVKILLSSLSNTGLIKTIPVGEGLYVLPEMSDILRKISFEKDLVKGLIQNATEIKDATLKLQDILKDDLSACISKTSEKLSSEVASAVRKIIERPVLEMFDRLVYELSKSVTLHEKRVLSELKVLEAPIKVLSSQVEKSSKEVNVKLENKINECSKKISSELPKFKEQLKELLNQKIADAFKKEEAYRLVSFERIEKSEAKIRDIILEVGQILERILVIFGKTLTLFKQSAKQRSKAIIEENMKEIVTKLSKEIEEMINKYISQIDVDLRFITEDFHKQASEMEKKVKEDYEDLKNRLKTRFEEYPKFLRSLADFMISKALEQIDEWIDDFKETLASWMDDVIGFTDREFMRLKNITISTNKRILQEFSKYVEEMKDIVDMFVKERKLKFVNELITLTLNEVKNRTTEITKPLLNPIQKVISKSFPHLNNAKIVVNDSLRKTNQVGNLLTEINATLYQLISSRDTWIVEEGEAIKIIRKFLSLDVPWKINVILPSCELLNHILSEVSITPEIKIYCYGDYTSVKVPENVEIIRTKFKDVIALESEMLSMFLVPVGNKAAGIATTNNVFRILVNILIKNLLTTAIEEKI